MTRLVAVVIMVLIVTGALVEPAQADQTRDSQWHLAFLRIAEAHRHSQGEGVTVAVVDTGVDASHPDFAGAVIPGTDLHTGDGRQDIDGHGTAMAGLIAARGRGGGMGALGVAPRSTLLPVEAGGAGRAPLYDGLDWAVQHGAKVICIARATIAGGRLEDAVARAVAADVVVVAGVGNRPIASQVQAPAKFPGVVAAAGVDRAGNHAEISVTGPEAVLAAPAVNVLSTKAGGGYRSGTGTSDATAIIAGVAALVRARFPQLKAPEVIHRLTATAIDKGKPGRDEEYGFGIVDPVAALTANVPPLKPSISASTTAAPPPPSTKDGYSPVWWVVSGLLLAAAGAGTVIAFRRTRG